MLKQNIINTVQRNCDIANTQAANDYTLCVYLLKMREYYRWENKLGFNDSLANNDIGDWISAREQRWQELEDCDYSDITINNRAYSPFDAHEINRHLEPMGMVYSAGLGQQHRPHFFLGELNQHLATDDYQVYVTNTEFARELTAPPAMSINKTIFIRRQSLKRMIWERLEEWRWNKGQGAMAHALSHYDFEHDLDHALDLMTEHETDVLLHHEIGEIQAGKHLGEAWHTMLASLPRSKASFMARAVRDHMADCHSTLPMLVNEDRRASIHFYFGNFNAMRKEIFPSLIAAYEQWYQTGNLAGLRKTITAGKQHWNDVADSILDIHQGNTVQCADKITTLIENNKL